MQYNFKVNIVVNNNLVYRVFPGERELVEFLTEEIVAERKAQKVKTLPADVDGFSVKGDGAEVVLTKQLKDET